MHSNYLLQRQALKNKGPQPAPLKRGVAFAKEKTDPPASTRVVSKQRKPIAKKSAKKIAQEKANPTRVIRKPIAKKSGKKKAAEKAEIGPGGITKLSAFYRECLLEAPELCMETDQPLINTVYGENPMSIVVHLLPKRSSIQGGVPSMAKDKRNVVYFDGDIHDKYDADMGTKSKGKYVKSMRCYALLCERVADMWQDIPENERKNVPVFLQPKNI